MATTLTNNTNDPNKKKTLLGQTQNQTYGNKLAPTMSDQDRYKQYQNTISDPNSSSWDKLIANTNMNNISNSSSQNNQPTLSSALSNQQTNSNKNSGLSSILSNLGLNNQNWNSNLSSVASLVNSGYPTTANTSQNTAARASVASNGNTLSPLYGQRSFNVQSGSNDVSKSLIEMGNDGRTVNIDQSYVTSELPSYTQSEGQYGTYDTAVAKGGEYSDSIGDMSQWSYPLLKMAEELGSYKDLGLDAEHQAQIDSNYIQAQDLNDYQDRNLKEGYSAEDLAVMSQNGLNSLNSAYQKALNSAAADYNRLGLRGSGFELGNSYGNTEDSITGQYLSNVQKLQSEIDSKGLEAAREDLYKNADANDRNRENAIKSGLEIGAGMNDAAMKRIENEQQIQEKNRTGYKTAVDTINTLYGTSDQSQRGWAGQNETEHKNDADAIRELISLGKQSEATQYSTAAQLLGQLFGAIGTASSGGNRDALNGAVDRINQLTNGDNSYLNRILQELGLS